MIKVEFKINNEYLSKSYLHLIEQESEVVLRTTCFLMPTRFLIDEIDLFYDKKYPKFGPWHDMPIIGWATELVTLIKNLPNKKKDTHIFTHEGYRDILFEMKKEGKVRIKYLGTMNAFFVDYDELLNAFLKFENEVKKFLNEYVPQFKEHPYWSDWIKGKVEYDEDKGFIPIKKK